MTCTICRHAQREEIERALLAREPLRDIAGRYGASKTALARHAYDHLARDLVLTARVQEEARQERLAAYLLDLRDRAQRWMVAAEGAQDIEQAMRAMQRVEAHTRTLAELAGRLAAATTVNVRVNIGNLQAVILTALDPHPEARAAVARALHDHAGTALQ